MKNLRKKLGPQLVDVRRTSGERCDLCRARRPLATEFIPENPSSLSPSFDPVWGDPYATVPTRKVCAKCRSKEFVKAFHRVKEKRDPLERQRLHVRKVAPNPPKRKKP